MNNIQILRDKIKNLKVLFVDDEKNVRVKTGVFLKKFFDNVVICSDGDEALDMFKSTDDFDIIISDILMPRMNGIEMVKEIKKINHKIYVIFLTASRDKENFDKTLSDLIFQKPLTYDNMMLIMQNLSEIVDEKP